MPVLHGGRVDAQTDTSPRAGNARSSSTWPSMRADAAAQRGGAEVQHLEVDEAVLRVEPVALGLGAASAGALSAKQAASIFMQARPHNRLAGMRRILGLLLDGLDLDHQAHVVGDAHVQAVGHAPLAALDGGLEVAAADLALEASGCRSS
jgi:hypothetical protein